MVVVVISIGTKIGSSGGGGDSSIIIIIVVVVMKIEFSPVVDYKLHIFIQVLIIVFMSFIKNKK